MTLQYVATILGALATIIGVVAHMRINKNNNKGSQ